MSSPVPLGLAHVLRFILSEGAMLLFSVQNANLCTKFNVKSGLNMNSVIYLFNYQKANDKIFVCKFSKNVNSKLYHIENSNTRGQTV